MISKACYVQCDECGDPAEVAVGGAKEAREFARQQGYLTGRRDLCPRCRTDDKAAKALLDAQIASSR